MTRAVQVCPAHLMCSQSWHLRLRVARFSCRIGQQIHGVLRATSGSGLPGGVAPARMQSALRDQVGLNATPIEA